MSSTQTSGRASTTRQALKMVAFTVFVGTGCTSTPDHVNPKPLRDLCTKWGGIPLVVPDSRYVPGAIFTIPEGRPPGFVDSSEFLSSCKVPADLLKPIDSAPWSANTTDSVDFKAAAALAYQGISAGPEYSQVSSIKMEIPHTMVSGLPVARLNVWYQDNSGTWSAGCQRELERPDYFVVGEALSVKESKFTAHRADGTKLSITGATLGDYFKIEPSVAASITANGVVTIPQSSTMCVRQLSFNNGFKVLGDSATASETPPASRALLKHYDVTTGVSE